MDGKGAPHAPGAVSGDGLDRVRQVRRRRLGDKLEQSRPPDGVGSKVSERYNVSNLLSTAGVVVRDSPC